MEKIIIFGTGRRMYEYMMRDAFSEYEIVVYCDNDKSKHEKLIDGIKIISPEMINEYEYDLLFIASDLHYDEIRNQLINENGIEPSIIHRVEVDFDKYEGEMSFWKAYYLREGFDNSVYRNMILSILDTDTDEPFRDKIVADFGCGPQGTLVWTDKPKVKIGIDVLSTRYFEAFPEELQSHGMIYVQSSENAIPIGTSYVDYLITVNSLDHVYNLDIITSELKRILKPNGVLLAGFNLNEPKTECEPQQLSIAKLKKELLADFNVEMIKLEVTGQAAYRPRNLDEAAEIIGDALGVMYIRATLKK